MITEKTEALKEPEESKIVSFIFDRKVTPKNFQQHNYLNNDNSS